MGRTYLTLVHQVPPGSRWSLQITFVFIQNFCPSLIAVQTLIAVDKAAWTPQEEATMLFTIVRTGKWKTVVTGPLLISVK